MVTQPVKQEDGNYLCPLKSVFHQKGSLRCEPFSAKKVGRLNPPCFHCHEVLFLFSSSTDPSLSAICASFSLPNAKRLAACRYDAICQTGDITCACTASFRASSGISLERCERLRRAKTVGETMVPTSMNCKQIRKLAPRKQSIILQNFFSLKRIKLV